MDKAWNKGNDAEYFPKSRSECFCGLEHSTLTNSPFVEHVSAFVGSKLLEYLLILGQTCDINVEVISGALR